MRHVRQRALRVALAVVVVIGAVSAAPGPEREVGAAPIPPDRLASDDPYVISVDIARLIAGGNLAQLTDLIIATGEQPFDAIVSAGLAGYLDQCPRTDGSPCRRTATLLTRPGELPAVTAQAIAASGVPAARITVIGGTAAVSDQVRAEIATRSGWNGQGSNPVTRVAGATRYDTAAALAQHLATVAAQPGAQPLPASARTIIVATGEQPADALAASALAYRGGHLLVLSPPATRGRSLDTAVRALAANCAVMVGGVAALPAEIETTIGASLASAGSGACAPERVAGADRHHTAALLATRMVGSYGSPRSVLIANTQSRALPLTAAPLARLNTSLLFTRPDASPAVTRAWVAQHPTITRVTVVGPVSDVSDAAGLEVAITPPPAVSGGGSGAGAGGGSGGGAGLSLSSATLAFNTAQSSQVLAATATGGTGSYSYTYAGTLPQGVNFNGSTGEFTGPAQWGVAAVSVSAGARHSCAVLADTTLRCWGATNTNGRLGDGTSDNRLHPVTVTTGAGTALSGVTQVSAGGGHTCALINDGTVRCWGFNSNGQLGDGTTTESLLPVSVTISPGGAPLSGVTRISAGSSHTCALINDGTVRCWGLNGVGQLGDGTTAQRTSPVTVTVSANTSLSGVTQVSAGYDHTCAVINDADNNGTVRCWGNNGSGQLGDGTTAQRTSPVTVTVSANTSLSGVTQVSAGWFNHTCVVMTDTSARCWGGNDAGQLGDGTTAQRTSPVTVTVSANTSLSGVTQVSAGRVFTCAVLADTTARCWGSRGFSWPTHAGRLGDGFDAGFEPNPRIVLLSGTSQTGPSLSGVTRLSSGEEHTCVVVTGGLRCWGYNGNGFGSGLGDGTDFTTPFRSNPVRVLASGTEDAAPIPLAGSLSFGSVTVTVTVTDGSGATASATVTLTSGP